MRILRLFFANTFYFVTAIICLAIVFSPIVASWWLVYARADVKDGRMQWCVVAKRPLIKGLKLTEQNVDWTIRRVRKGDGFIPDTQSAIGKYATIDLNEGELLKPEYLSEFAPAKTDETSAAIPIEVKSEHAAALKPGMRLAFVQEQEKKSVMVPEAGSAQTTASGFELISITTSSKDASAITIIVSVSKTDLAKLQGLAVGQWRPVILTSPGK